MNVAAGSRNCTWKPETSLRAHSQISGRQLEPIFLAVLEQHSHQFWGEIARRRLIKAPPRHNQTTNHSGRRRNKKHPRLSTSLLLNKCNFYGSRPGGETRRLVRTVTPGALVHIIGSLLTEEQVATVGGSDAVKKASRNPDRTQRHKPTISNDYFCLLTTLSLVSQKNNQAVSHFSLFCNSVNILSQMRVLLSLTTPAKRFLPLLQKALNNRLNQQFLVTI